MELFDLNYLININDKLVNKSDEEIVRILKEALPTKFLGRDHQKYVLEGVLEILNKVRQEAEKNKMTVDNLAKVFAPNLFKKTNDPKKELDAINQVQFIMGHLIKNYQEIFSEAE